MPSRPFAYVPHGERVKRVRMENWRRLPAWNTRRRDALLERELVDAANYVSGPTADLLTVYFATRLGLVEGDNPRHWSDGPPVAAQAHSGLDPITIEVSPRISKARFRRKYPNARSETDVLWHEVGHASRAMRGVLLGEIDHELEERIVTAAIETAEDVIANAPQLATDVVKWIKANGVALGLSPLRPAAYLTTSPKADVPEPHKPFWRTRRSHRLLTEEASVTPLYNPRFSPVQWSSVATKFDAQQPRMAPFVQYLRWHGVDANAKTLWAFVNGAGLSLYALHDLIRPSSQERVSEAINFRRTRAPGNPFQRQLDPFLDEVKKRDSTQFRMRVESARLLTEIVHPKDVERLSKILGRPALTLTIRDIVIYAQGGVEALRSAGPERWKDSTSSRRPRWISRERVIEDEGEQQRIMDALQTGHDFASASAAAQAYLDDPRRWSALWQQQIGMADTLLLLHQRGELKIELAYEEAMGLAMMDPVGIATLLAARDHGIPDGAVVELREGLVLPEDASPDDIERLLAYAIDSMPALEGARYERLGNSFAL